MPEFPGILGLESHHKVQAKGIQRSYDFFFGLINIERSAMRVLERAVSGGHNVSLPEIELNYYGNLLQLDRNYKLLDELKIIDTSEIAPKLLLQLMNNTVVYKAEFFDLPDGFSSHLIKITRLMYPNI